MERLIQIAADLLDFCETESWRACVIGELAVQRWGEPRLTLDVDEGILIRQGSALNVQSIEAELGPLVAAKESPGILTRLSEMLRTL